MNTVILDFVNVVADLDIKNIIKGLSFKQKYSALRIYLAMKRNEEFSMIFDAYQKGLFDSRSLQKLVHQHFPQSSDVIPILLERLSNNIIVNKQVLDYVEAIKEKGAQVLLMSNSTPETEMVMQEYNLNEIFDGVILSTKVKSIKPEKEIFKDAIYRYNIDTPNSIMIDDTKKNLITAESFGIEGIRCCNSNETCETLETYLDYLDIYESSEILSQFEKRP